MESPNQQPRRWRLWIATQMLRAARALEFFSVAVLRPEDFVACTRRFYTDPLQVADLVKKSAEGLYAFERAVLGKITSDVGVALVLGCGTGREAIALAKHGWEVVGLDSVPTLIEAAEAKAVQAGVRVEWHCQDITRGFVLDRAFDLVCLFGQFYSLVPGRTRRIRLLSACRQHMKRDGFCVLNFVSCHPASEREGRAHRWRKRFAWLVGGNRDCQLGDQWYVGRLFVHQFATLEEIAEEAVAAGLDLEADRDGTPVQMAILRPAATRPALSGV